MEQLSGTTAGKDSVLLLVGTMKGAFLLWSDEQRQSWRVDGPHFKGEAVYALAFDDRGGRNRTFAAPRSMHWGATVRSSEDFGATWSSPERQSVRFPAETGQALAQIWQIRPGPKDEPDTLYCGVEPASLFQSRDGGESWDLVEGLFNHEHRPKWQPGGGGLCLHTILLDPNDPLRILIAVSAAGVYRSDDGAQTWRARNVGVRAEFLPDKYPEFGQCVHKVVHHPSRPESDLFRCTPEAKLRVYRTNNAGESWEAMTDGLPQSNAYETVLRDALTADSLDPAGVIPYSRSSNVVTLDEQFDTVGDVLAALASHSPGVVDRVMDERGKVREHVNVFVNESSIRFAQGMDTPVPSGSRILILAAISGG